MATQDGETEGALDDLLKQMPRIAEAVKAFPEAVQPRAFEMLMAEARGSAPAKSKPTPTAKRTTKRRGAKAQADADGVERKSTRRRKGSPSRVRELDLAPKGKTSLKDFVAEKQPKTNHDKNVVAVYYLGEVLALAGVTLDHVFTCYRDVPSWREPADLANSLALTANRKGYLDTANLDAITVTPKGRTYVEHDLPVTKE